MARSSNILRLRAAFAFILLVFASVLSGQTCSSCDETYAVDNATPIFVMSGTVCIGSGVTCHGPVYMQGGVLCNHGTITQLILGASSGTIHNYHEITSNELNSFISGTLVVNNYPGGSIDFNGQDGFYDVTIDGMLRFRSFNQSVLSFNCDLNVNEGRIELNSGIYSVLQYEDEDLTSTINFETGNFNGSEVSINTTGTGLVNAAGSINLNNEGNKAISNSGIININGALMIGGDGGSSSVEIENTGLFYVVEDVNVEMIDASISILNTENSDLDELISIGGNLNIYSEECTVVNGAYVMVDGSINQITGSFVNDFSLEVNDHLRLSGGTFSNNANATITNFKNNSSGNFSNAMNAQLNISNTFSNNAIANLGKQSSVNTATYYNGTGGVITGPSLSGPEAAAFVHGKIIISGFSQNTSTLSGYVLVYDQSLVASSGNIGFGFDNVSNTVTIGSNVAFVATSNGTSVEIDCAPMQGLYYLGITTPTRSYCPYIPLGNLLYRLYQGTAPNTSNPVGATYTIQPGNIVTTNIAAGVSPTVTTIYTINASYNGCIYTQTTQLNVCEEQQLPTISYSVSPFLIWTGATFAVTQTGATGGTYAISPPCTSLQINPSTGLISVIGPYCFSTFTVTYCLPQTTCCGETTCVATTVTFETLDCPFYFNQDVSLCEGEKIVLNPTGGYGTYFWSPTPTTTSVGLSCTACPAPTLSFGGTATSFTVRSYRNGVECASRTISVTVRADCPKEEIIGCCFSNYGAAVWLNDAQTHLNIYCNLVNELGYTSTDPTPLQKGEFNSYYGKVRVDLEWIHNAKNTLYNTGTAATSYGGSTHHPAGIKNGESALIGLAQNIKGNSVTDFNDLMLQGMGTKTMKISANSTGNLHLYGNILAVHNHTYSMKNANSWVKRHSGYASTEEYGYFSHVLGNAAAVTNQAYLYPLGSTPSGTNAYRYSPLIMANNATTQADEVSANLYNYPPSLNDPAFVNTNTTLTNNVLAQAPSVLLVNQKYYHKIENTTPPASTSSLQIKSYYTTFEGPYQSLAEWERDPAQTLDWWGSTPGGAGSSTGSPDSVTLGLLYAQANGTFSFNHEPFALSKGGFYINTTNFGNGNGSSSGAIITVTATQGGGGTSTPSMGGLGSPFGTGPNSGNTGNGGSTVFSPNPVTGDYIITVTPLNNCGVPSKIKFTVDQFGNIAPQSVQFGLTTQSGYLGELSTEVFTIDNVNTGIILASTPKDLLTACVNTISIGTSGSGGGYVVNKSTESLNIQLPTVVGPTTINYGTLKLYDASGFLAATSSALTGGSSPTSMSLSSLATGVYRFEMLVSVSTSPPITEMVKGQIIVK